MDIITTITTGTNPLTSDAIAPLSLHSAVRPFTSSTTKILHRPLSQSISASQSGVIASNPSSWPITPSPSHTTGLSPRVSNCQVRTQSVWSTSCGGHVSMDTSNAQNKKKKKTKVTACKTHASKTRTLSQKQKNKNSAATLPRASGPDQQVCESIWCSRAMHAPVLQIDTFPPPQNIFMIPPTSIHCNSVI
jgi:hypothetical protein